jgi:hypothetical protein
MHKTKHDKKRDGLDPALICAIEKTTEAAILSRLSRLDGQITQTIRDCLSEKFDAPHSKCDGEQVRKVFNPDAGP